MHRVGVIIPAAGQGARLGGRIPKQFLILQRLSILERTVQRFQSSKLVHEIVLVVPAGYIRRVHRLAHRAKFSKVSNIVRGGTQRQDSVWNGLRAFEIQPDVVLVHDAVRPLVTGRIIEQVIRQSRQHGAAVVGVPVKDTIKVEDGKGFYAKTLDRTRLWAVQTPQGFRYDLLLKAHRKARKSGFVGTDEASLVERLRAPVRIVVGDYRNIKITTKEDLQLAAVWLRRPRLVSR